MSISLVLPAYQEAGNLRELLPRIHAALARTCAPYEVLVVDTAVPTDETPALCAEHGVTRVPRSPGDTYGDAIRTGFAAAQYEYIAVMDADGSHDPADILRFLAEMQAGTCDLVIGSRYAEGGKTHNPLILRSMSYMLNWTYRVVFGIQAKDVSNSFRLYKANQVKALSLECDNFDLVEEILIKLQVQNERQGGFVIKEIPVFFNKRMYGESKRDLVKFVLSYLATMLRLYRIKCAAARRAKEDKKHA